MPKLPPEHYDNIPADQMTPWLERKRNGYLRPYERADEPLVPPPPSKHRKDLSEIRKLAQEYTTRAIDVLLHIAENGRNEAARVNAAKDILDRGWGKAIQVTEEKPQVATNIAISFPEQSKPQITQDAVYTPSDDTDDD